MTAHSFGAAGHRSATPMPIATAANIHTTGNFMAIATFTKCRDSR
jgi:hypothetical protein